MSAGSTVMKEGSRTILSMERGGNGRLLMSSQGRIGMGLNSSGS